MSSFGPAGGGGADDDAAGEAVLLAELPDDAAQARALFARLDLARDADVVDRRHEHQEAARHRDVRGQPGALGAERLLDDLDEDFLPFFQQVFDLAARGRLLRARVSRAATAVAAAAALADARLGRSAPSPVVGGTVATAASTARLRRRTRGARTPRRC